MNNKYLSWNKEINNNFIIASRAYFLQSPTCTGVNNLVHIVMWFNSNSSHLYVISSHRHVTNTQRVLLESIICRSCFACGRSLVNGSVTFRVVCIFQIFYVYNALHGATLANCSHFQYVSRSKLRVIWIGVKACIDVTLYDELFITSITEKYLLSIVRIILTAVQWSTHGSILYPLAKLMAS